jgi:hypothetical protein
MSTRRLILGLLGAATITLAACSTTGSTSSPTPTSTQVSESASAMPSESAPGTSPAGSASSAAGLQGFCADVAAKLTASWPNVDATTAASLGPLLTTWASKPEVASQQADIATIAAWLTTMAAGGAAASPPADVQTAFDHLKAFADTNC